MNRLNRLIWFMYGYKYTLGAIAIAIGLVLLTVLTD